jgi:hypothetical protein
LVLTLGSAVTLVVGLLMEPEPAEEQAASSASSSATSSATSSASA